MARIKIEIPDKLLGTFTIPVRITDLNYGNHVGNDAFVSIIHEIRMQWLNSFGFTELDIEGTGLIMSDIAVEFKGESFYGDIILAKLFCGDISKVGFELFYELSAKRNETDVLVAKAKTAMVSFDYNQKKVINLPEKLLELLSK